MKKLCFILMIFFSIVLFFSGCGTDTETIKDGDTEIEYTKNLKDSVAIPEDYPNDVIPVYKDSFIASAAKNKDGSYCIMSFTNDDFKKVANFYKEILKDAEVLSSQDNEEEFLSIGSINNSSYTVTVTPADQDIGYKTMASIILLPGEMMNGLNGNSSENDFSDEASGGYTVPENITFPEDYPSELVPIYNRGETKIAASREIGKEQIIGFMTKSNIEDVKEYYTKKLGTADGFSVQKSGMETIIKGEKDGCNFKIMITSNTEDKNLDMSYSTLVQINYH